MLTKRVGSTPAMNILFRGGGRVVKALDCKSSDIIVIGSTPIHLIFLMAWYQRSYFSLFYVIILSAAIILFNQIGFMTSCVDFRGINNLVNLQHNSTLIKHCSQIHSLKVQRAFDESANFIIQNPNYNINICKYFLG